ncbi:hypothetical protein NKG94_01405 [Micromonospora sp. M12]
MRITLEQADPGQHNHAGHGAQQVATAEGKPAVICGVRVYGYEPAEATALADVRTVYGFHLCGVAEKKRPWDVAVKLAGPLIMDMSTEPPGIQVVEATADVRFVDRLREMFPDRYEELALKEALTPRRWPSSAAGTTPQPGSDHARRTGSPPPVARFRSVVMILPKVVDGPATRSARSTFGQNGSALIFTLINATVGLGAFPF